MTHELEPLWVGDNDLLMVTRAEAANLDDWNIANDVLTAPDRAFLVGRYCHGGLPANSNGHIFRTDELPTAHRFIPNTPLDMLHDPRRVVGAHVKAKMLFPKTARQPQAGAPAKLDVATYVNVLAVVWSYLFPDDARTIAAAHENGTAFLSMSCLPTAGIECPSCGHQAAWAGYSSDTYCSHMQGVNAKLFNKPLFLGGACIVPPVQPGWKHASMTQFAQFARTKADLTGQTFDQLAAAAGNATQAQLEALVGGILARAYSGDPALSRDVSRLVAPLAGADIMGYADIDFATPEPVLAAITTTEGAWAAEAELLRSSQAGPADIEWLVNTLTEDPAAAAALGGDATLAWAEDVWRTMVTSDLEVMAAGLTPDRRARWAKDGTAMSDGSYPIPNLAYLRKAIRAWGRATNKAATKAHILKRARALNAPQGLIDQAERLGQAMAHAAITAALANQTGVIVAVVPPPEIRDKLAAAGSMPADEIHITMAFLGNVVLPDPPPSPDQPSPAFDIASLDTEDGVSPFTLDQLQGAVAGWAAGERPILATTSGIGAFDQGDTEVTYVSVDAPGLNEMRSRLVAALSNAGVPFSNLHGFTPHITVAETAPGKGPKQVPTGLAWQINHVEVWWAGSHIKVDVG